MLVNVPVETSQAVFGGVAMSARYMASRWSTSVAAGSTGLGGQGRGWDKELSGECGTGIGGGVRQSRGEGVGLGEGGGRGEGGSKSGGRGGRLLRA